MTDTLTQQVITLMNSYAQRTGLSSDRPRKRYLWTDAFAVCNYLGLARVTGDRAYAELALKLVNQVHHSLGQHRKDEPHGGWISGLSREAGEKHPTVGGLRIGKSLPERGVKDAFDDRLEWDRDGQYFHYLSKWMYALDLVARATRQPHYNLWARELAETAFKAFSYPISEHEPRRMVWKMSIDLSRPLVPSMGQSDPLDGYITSVQLHATATTLSQPHSAPSLENEINEYALMIQKGEWHTDDPLGLGGLLMEAYRVIQLQQQGVKVKPRLLDQLLDAVLTGLSYFSRSGHLQMPAHYRLAFRELGLAIGLHALERMQWFLDSIADEENKKRLQAKFIQLKQYTELAEEIEAFWLNPQHQQSDTWTEHQDINEVMLATSLGPDGFLELLPPKKLHP